MNNSKIYKRLSGGAKYPVGDAVWYLVIGLVIFGSVMTIAISATNFAAWGMLAGAASGALAAAIFAKFFAIKRLRRTKRSIDNRRRKFESISEAEWDRIDDEVASVEFFFGTFYLLGDYLYIPKPRLLLPYLDIKNFQTVIHSTNGLNDAVYINLTDGSGFLYKFYVRKWRDYLEFQYMFLDMLNEKIAEKAGRSQ